MSGEDPRRAGRILLALASALLPPDRNGRARLGDLIEEAGEITTRRGALATRLWLSAQLAGIALGGLGRAVAGADGLRADLRESLRSIVRQPWSTSALLGMLAIAIGAGTAVFAVVDTVLFRPLPYAQPETLVRAEATRVNGDGEPFDLTWAEATTLEAAQTLGEVAAFSVVFRTLLDEDDGDPRSVLVVRTRGSLSDLLGVSPLLGRGLSDDETRTGAPVAVVSESLWGTRFGRDPSIVGRTLYLESGPREIVGVVAGAHAYPHEADVWLPLAPGGDEDDDREVHVVTRIAEGVGPAAAGTEVSALAVGLAERFPESNSEWTLRLQPLQSAIIGDRGTTLHTYLAAVIALLLVVGMNASHLMLVRAAARDRETAIRAALGGGRWRIARARLVESVLIGLGAGLLALPIGHVVLRWFAASAAAVPRIETVRLDARVTLTTLTIAVLASVLCGILPTLRTAATDLRTVLANGRTVTRRRRGVAGPGLVVSEVAVSTTLVAVALALGSTLRDTLRYDRGFEVEGLVAFDVEVEGRESADELVGFFADALESTRELPSVTGAAFTSHPVTEQRGLAVAIRVDGAAPDRTEGVTATTRIVSDGFFRTAGIPLVEGRAFEPRVGERPPELVVNELFVRTFLAEHPAPVGAYVDTDWAEGTVVGIVGDVSPAIQEPARPVVYLPLDQVPIGGSLLIVRTRGAASELGPEIWAAIRGIEPSIVPRETAVLATTIRASVAAERFNLAIVGAFAAVALVLAGFGVFGVASETVSGRLREVGIRRALGGSVSRVIREVLGGTARVVVVGVALGIGGAAIAGRVVGSLFVGVTPGAPAVQLAVGTLLAATALVASTLPLLRIARVSPVEVLGDD